MEFLFYCSDYGLYGGMLKPHLISSVLLSKLLSSLLVGHTELSTVKLKLERVTSFIDNVL